MSIPRPSPRDDVQRWTELEAFVHLSDTFEQEARRFPDLMEPYANRLPDTNDIEEKTQLMRQGLRETIEQRYPLHSTTSATAAPT